MNAKPLLPLLLLSLATTVVVRGQMTAQAIKTCQMLGMQPYTVSVQYTYYHFQSDYTRNHDNKPINAYWQGSVTFTADFYMMPGDPAANMGQRSPENMVRWTAGGASSFKLDSGCSASVGVSGEDGPRLNWDYRGDNSWSVGAQIQPKNPQTGKQCVVAPFGSLGFYPGDATFTRNGKGFAVSGNYRRDTSINGHRDITTGDFHMVVTPTGPPQDWEARIVPVDKANYPKWLPLGPPLNGSYKKGNTITFTISIRQKKDTNVLYPFSYAVDWSLHSVTNNEGYCGNYPAREGGVDTKPDLRFDDSVYRNNKALASFAQDHLVSKTDEGMGVPAIVTCFDYGAYGLLEAKITLHDGTALDAFSYRKPDKAAIPIPCDDNDNKVADYYENQQKIYNKNYAADWDEEPLLGKSKGDGLTFFEEYRGFALEDANGNRVHRRLSPDTAEAFYHTIYGEDFGNVNLFKQGAKLYTQTTGVNLIYIKDGTLLGKEDNGDWPIRKLNFNHCLADKYNIDAVVIKSNTENKRTWTPPVSGDEARSYCPAETNFIAIYMKNDFQDDIRNLPPNKPVNKTAWSLQMADTLLANNVNIDVHFPTIANTIAQSVSQLNQNLIIFEVMHEFGHATGMRHHQVDQYLTDDKANDKAHETAIDIANFLANVKNNANDPGIGKSIDSIIARVYQLSGYTPTSTWNYFTRGDDQCPMNYWYCDYHAVEYLTFLSGKWKPAQNAPIITQWKFCDINKQEMHLHP